MVLHSKKKSGREYLVTIILVCIWLFCTVSYFFLFKTIYNFILIYLLLFDLQVILMAKQEKIVDDVHQVTLAPNETKSIVKV